MTPCQLPLLRQYRAPARRLWAPSYPLALVPPPLHAAAGGSWQAEQNSGRTICRFYGGTGIICGFGVSAQDANIRSELLTALGSSAISTNADAAA